jgi:AraC family transcriptional regulator of adaptative response/methylated-DNA-[protein]-cysteine methyltransferase
MNQLKVNFIWINRHTIVDTIQYGVHETDFGTLLIATTQHGICSAQFLSDKFTKASWLKQMAKQWRKTQFIENTGETEQWLDYFSLEAKNTNPAKNQPNDNKTKDIMLHIHASDFQRVIWEELVNIPFGKTMSYSEVAREIGNPQANRAVGSAVGANPIAILIPCHRVLRSNGELGGYRWGESLKAELINWEAELLERN